MITYINHLVELRERLLRSLYCFLISFGLLFYFSNECYEFFSSPLLSLLPDGHHLIATNITATLMAPLKLCLFLSLLISIPFLLIQLWQFVAPGLYPNERSKILPLMFLSCLLFYLGVIFAFIILIPISLSFFVKIIPTNILLMADIESYYGFVTSLILGAGLAFQIPIITFTLISLDIISAKSMGCLRPHVIVISFILGMILTPPDVLSQCLLAIPMWILFETGLIMAKISQYKNPAQT